MQYLGCSRFSYKYSAYELRAAMAPIGFTVVAVRVIW